MSISIVLLLFRWWPAQIISERSVPDTLKSKPTKCMFLVRFFATGQYFWTHHGRVISFTEECTAIKEEKKTSVAFKQQNVYKEGKDAYAFKCTYVCLIDWCLCVTLFGYNYVWVEIT